MTNPVLDAILSRSSIRSYTGEPLTDEQVKALSNAALAAPSATNRQPWHVSVVKDTALLLEIEKATVDYFVKVGDEAVIERNKSRGDKIFYNAPIAFFISIDEGDFPPVDCGIMVENIALAAKGMGLDSVILGMPRVAFKDNSEFAKKLKFPDGYRFGICIAVGYAAGELKPPHELDYSKLTVIG